ncbi:Elongation factor-like GTPase 1 [Pseudolycoriella hygida]|uniref:Elongation factor-like GTPase 1 n=1 Tax=Pseudolycoriella hygida TaxID=35572 RepID=A0A9Q0RX22_9DIPT|nr:Elongation factor-like GTPase 1 [Pseudolycoriella hygida]
MPQIDKVKLVSLQQDLQRIRNICILAHVDHGKTTLADSLVASNGIISQKMVGKLRYMDSRSDEQERGITMKSSSISLHHVDRIENKEFLINLIDSPGHVDFSSEVSTAVRLCDGAIVLVDALEGVCSQTRICLKHAYLENLKPILVLNKIDRLITEKQLSALDAYVHLSQVLEQVNAVMGNLFAADVMSKETPVDTHDCGLEEADDSTLYFAPANGNVIFCSALDNWAFTTTDFAQLYAPKLNLPLNELANSLWGDFYFNAKEKKIVAGAQEKAKKPMFVQFILENIWNLYDVLLVRKDKEKIPIITEKLDIKLSTRDLRHTDHRVQLQAIFSQWLPIAKTVLEIVIKQIPSPGSMSEEKAERLMCSLNQNFSSLPEETQALKSEFQKSDKDSDIVIAFISKMIPVSKDLLPDNRPKSLTSEEIARRRTLARQRHQELATMKNVTETVNQAAKELEKKLNVTETEELETNDSEDDVFIGFARVYSGTLKKGAKLFALMPKHDPRTLNISNPMSSQYISEVTIENLFLLMGRDLEDLDEVPAGNIVGIGGLQNSVLKTATISTNVFCPSFSEMQQMATPILRVAVETQNPIDMPKLLKGFKLLNQADACVQIIVQENGEHVLLTLGEVHLERCIADLEQRYAKVKLNVSPPIVPFRETIVPDAKVDMVNEIIVNNGKSLCVTLPFANVEFCFLDENNDKSVNIYSANKQSKLKLLALPLDDEIVHILDENTDLLKALSQASTIPLSDRTKAALNDLQTNLAKSFRNSTIQQLNASDAINRIWSIGPKKCGNNILLNATDFIHKSFWLSTDETKPDVYHRNEYETSFINGFQLSSSAGPLCEEPMHGVCFIVEEWTLSDDVDASGIMSGQIISTVKEACRKAFQNQSQRLVTPMYACNIVCDADVLVEFYK